MSPFPMDFNCESCVRAFDQLNVLSQVVVVVLMMEEVVVMVEDAELEVAVLEFLEVIEVAVVCPNCGIFDGKIVIYRLQ